MYFVIDTHVIQSIGNVLVRHFRNIVVLMLLLTPSFPLFLARPMERAYLYLGCLLKTDRLFSNRLI